MGKRLDDLRLDDNPLLPPDERESEWYQFVKEIEDLLPDRQWAAETLEGIQETVEKTRRVTDNQRRAVENIRAAEGRSEGSRRRYEGWGKGGRR